MVSYEKRPSDSSEERNEVINNSTLAAALLALQKGYSVIPVGRDKRPLIKWEYFQHERASEEDVREWSRKWPDMNYGIVTGSISGITVLDVDAKYGGLETLEQLRDKLPEVPMVATGGGGYHFYFTHGGEVSLSNTAIGLDIRGSGGYVVGAGSVHENGTAYIYELDLRNTRPMPRWLYEMAKKRPEVKNQVPEFEPVFTKEGEEVPVILEGQRNSTLAKKAGALHRKGLNHEELSVLLTHVNATQCVPPLLDDEVNTIVRSISHYDRETLKLPHRFNPLHASEWANEVIAEPEYEINIPAIAKGHLVMFAGPSKSGKSTTIRAMALAKAKGSDFLGEPVPQGNVLYIAAEENPNDVKRAFQKLGVTDTTPLWVHYGNVGDYAEAMSGIREYIQEKDIKLVIVDTAFKLREKSFDANAYNAGYDWAEPFMDMAHDENIAVVMLHHVNKKGWNSEGYDALRGVLGSSALSAAVDSVISIRRDDKDTRYLFGHGRLDDMSPIVLHFNKDTQEVTHGGSKHEYAMLEKTGEILDLLDGEGLLSRQDIAEKIGGSAKVLSDALKHLVEIEEVVKEKDGRKDYYSLFRFSESKGEKNEKLEEQGEYEGM